MFFLHGRHRHVVGRLVRVFQRPARRWLRTASRANAFMTTTLRPRPGWWPRPSCGRWLLNGSRAATERCSGFASALWRSGVIKPARFVTRRSDISASQPCLLPIACCRSTRFGYDDALDTFGVPPAAARWGHLLTECWQRQGKPQLVTSGGRRRQWMRHSATRNGLAKLVADGGFLFFIFFLLGPEKVKHWRTTSAWR